MKAYLSSFAVILVSLVLLFYLGMYYHVFTHRSLLNVVIESVVVSAAGSVCIYLFSARKNRK
jgi:hypothetical protein